jgi:hypothetical protein
VLGEHATEKDAVRANNLINMAHMSSAAQLHAYLQQQAGMDDAAAAQQQQQQQQPGEAHVAAAFGLPSCCRTRGPAACSMRHGPEP